jgi:hypothetical protein
MSRIFLSHSHGDKPFVRRLATDLVQANLKVWIDEVEIKVGESLIAKIQEGIDSSDYIAAILSVRSVSSSWVREELNMALTDQINGKRVAVLPLKIDDCELPGFLRSRLYLDFSDNARYRDSFRKLVRDVGAHFTVDDDFPTQADVLWHCIYCGWRCQIRGNNYFCLQCRAVRPRPPEGSATTKICPECQYGNIVIASFCEGCGYPFGYRRV